jgi:hypothetical protein
MAKKTIANLNIRIGADSARLKRDFGKAKGSVSSFAATIAKLGPIAVAVAVALAGIVAAAISIRQVVAGVRREFEALDKAVKTAKKLGTTLSELEGIRIAGGFAGIEGRTIDMALQRMTRRIAEAAEGTGEAKKTLEELTEFGLASAKELNRLGPAEALKRIADAMQKVEGSGTRLRIAFKLFDSEGAALVNLMRDGAGAIEAGERAAKRLGLTVSDLDTASVEEMNDRFGDLGRAMSGAFRQLGVALAPELKTLAVDLTNAIVTVKDAIVDLRPEIRATAHIWMTAMKPIIESVRLMAEGVRSVVDGLQYLRGIELASSDGGPGKFKDILDRFKRAEDESVEAIGKAIVTMTGTMVDELGRAGEALRLSLRTPEEKFREDLARFRELLDAEAITGETFRRARERAFGELKDALAKTEKAIKPVSTGAVTRRTAAGFAAVREYCARWRTRPASESAWQRNLSRSNADRKSIWKNSAVALEKKKFTGSSDRSLKI